jgi:AcrR family transcriptional regulator
MVFAEDGPAAATIVDIARRAGMTAAAVYYHFPSRADLLHEVVRDVGVSLLDVTVLPGDGDAEAQLSGVLASFARWAEEHAAEARLYFVATAGAGLRVQALRRDQLGVIVRRTAEALLGARPSLTQTEAYIAAIGLVTLFIETVTAWLDHPDTERAELWAAADQVGQRILRAARTDREPRDEPGRSRRRLD